MTEPTGGCLCGAVTYVVDGPLRDVLHCHCVNCRKVSGNFVASSGSATSDLAITDDAGRLRWYDLGYASYGFCSTCGSSLFWRGAEHDNRTSIQAGSLFDASDLSLAGVWFSQEAQSHLIVDETVPHFVANDDGGDV